MKLNFGWFSVLFLAISASVLAGESDEPQNLVLQPGLWSIESTTHLPALSQSVSNQINRCLKIQEIDPSKMFHESRQCTTSEKTVIENVMTWKLRCRIPGRGQATGRGEFISNGDSAEGQTSLLVFHRGKDIEMINRWSGKREGFCQ